MSFNSIKVNNSDTSYTHSIFDISEYTGRQYSDLSSALADIPTEKQSGGMTVRYVQSSDNKYVQYFLTKDEWSSSEADWEKVNLKEEISQLGQLLPNIASKYSIQVNTWYGEDYLHWVIPVNGGETVSFTSTFGVGYFAYLTSYITPVAGATPSFVTGYEGRQALEQGDFTIPAGTKYLIVNQPDLMGYTSIKINGIELIGGVYTALSNAGLKIEKDRNDIITNIITQKLLLRPGYCQSTTWRMDMSEGDAHILIPVNPGDIVQWSGDSYTNYYILLTDYITPVAGATPSFVSGYEGRQVLGGETKQLTIPNTCKYIALTCELLTLSRFTSLNVNGFNLLDGWGQYIEQIAKNVADVITDSDLTIEITSNNLANPNNIGGGLVDNVGVVSFAPISPSNTWRLIMIPLSADVAGRKITFGGFYLGRTGYSAFYNGSTLVSFYQNDDPNGRQTPITLTIPSGCDRLYIDIMSSSSPYELDNNYTYLMVNFGETLLDYEEFKEKITKINNIVLAGASIELENRVTELEANVVDFVVADLPVSDGADIQSGYAYIDSTNRCVKVKA